MRTQVRTFKSCTLCLDSSLFPVLFHNDIPDRFFRPFKNDGQVLIPFCKNRLFVSAILISILWFLLQLTPFVNLSVDTLTKAKRLTHFYSVAPLLEKRFACFPTSGDSFFVSHFHIFRFYSYYFLFFCVCPHLPLSSAPLTL